MSSIQPILVIGRSDATAYAIHLVAEFERLTEARLSVRDSIGDDLEAAAVRTELGWTQIYDPEVWSRADLISVYQSVARLLAALNRRQDDPLKETTE